MLRGLVCDGAFVLVGLHRCLEVLDVALVEVALGPRRLVLGVSLFHVLGLGLVIHCLGKDFLELGDLGIITSRKVSSLRTCIIRGVVRRLLT